MQIKIQDNFLDVFIKGTYLKKDKNAVAIVGSRKVTLKGIENTRLYSSFLAKNGITIVSGLALGVDTIAHESALDAKGRTIAVLGHGLDRIYPTQNEELAKRIIKNGCLMTKYEEGTIPFPQNFLARNQIIAGLSKAVLVIEGERRSGSLSTANHAANLGIEVFAIPGSGATDFLIENGANVANKPEDILDFLKLAVLT